MNDMLTTTPDFSIEAAAALLREHYGLTGTLSPLASERDQNFKVEAAGETFILKIVNAAEPAVESDFQTALLAHIGTYAGDLPVPHIRTQLQPSLEGYKLTLTTDTLARDVWVSFGDLDAEMDDNAFDILPGQSVTVGVKSKALLNDMLRALQVQNLAGVMQGQ